MLATTKHLSRETCVCHYKTFGMTKMMLVAAPANDTPAVADN